MYLTEDWPRIYTQVSVDACKGLYALLCAVSATCKVKSLWGNKPQMSKQRQGLYMRQQYLYLSSSSLNKTRAVFFVDSQEAVLAVCSTRPSDYSFVNRTKEEMSQLITRGWEVAFQWIPSYCGIPGNDMVGTLAKHALNLSPPEEPITYQQTVAEIARNSALLVLELHTHTHTQKRRTKPGREYWRTKLHVLYLEVSSLSVRASSLDTTVYCDT
jgi:hypothetical protein